MTGLDRHCHVVHMAMAVSTVSQPGQQQHRPDLILGKHLWNSMPSASFMKGKKSQARWGDTI